MGFLDFIFGKKTTIDHAFFGTMVFLENKKEPLKSYFECRRQFAPTGKIIQIGIDGDASGPTPIQVDFFKSIEQHYAEISATVIPFIEKEFRNWDAGFTINNFQQEFEAVHLSLPRCDSKPVIWEMAFESEHDSNHLFTLTMSDFKATDIVIDG